MLEEAYPSQETIRINVLMDLEYLLKKSEYAPPYDEFQDFVRTDNSKQNNSERENLLRIATKANLDQALNLLRRLKEIDRDGAKSEIIRLLEENKKNMPDHFYDDLTNFMRLRY